MIDDPDIDPAIAARVEAELAAIEHAESVRILLAVESGSRAWRFPSRDSDYDVRFLYVRPMVDYLTIFPRRDVIERPVDSVFDVNGWDCGKALGLALRSNATLLEWLASPVRYRIVPDVVERIRDFAATVGNPAALAHHYVSLGRRSLADIDAATGAARLKTYCYALRAALALSWLRAQGTPPPMDVPSLLAGLAVPDAVRVKIATLIGRRRNGTERETMVREAALEEWLRSALNAPVNAPDVGSSDDFGQRADMLFRWIVMERAGSTF